MKIKKGDSVRYVIPDIVGSIVGARVDENFQLEYLVEFKDAAGEVQTRYFKESELVPEPAQVPVEEPKNA